VRLVDPYAPGGSTSVVSQALSKKFQEYTGQPMVVDHKPGAGSNIGAEIVARSPADGYTLLLSSISNAISAALYPKLNFDIVRDFAPITLLATTPGVLVVHPAVTVKSVRDLIALAKAKPGDLNYASGNAGTSNHLAAELFKSMAGVNITRIPYKGGAPAISDLVGGQVHLMFGASLAVAQHVQSGRLRALAVTSAKPSALAPGLPTVAEAGLPGYASVAIFGVLAPAKTPTALVERLNREIVKVLQQPEVKERLFTAGSEVVASSAEAFGAAIKSEMTTLGKLIKDSGIRDD
jgi:tripartite-type tricarboxylate transporter receptor subunit TctC